MPLMQDILDEADASNPAWLAKFHPPLVNKVDTSANQFVANATERAEVQRLGATYGCHTCNQLVANTPQNFIVDHIPPRGLFEKPTADGITYVFFPHCDKCALIQANLVRDVNAAPAIRNQLRGWAGNRGATQLAAIRQVLTGAGLNALKVRLLTGGVGAPIAGHGRNPTPTDRTAINTPGQGGAITCHCCGSAQASYIYHADHNPPREFAMTGWFPRLLASLQQSPQVVALRATLANSFFRPQCPYCSHRQGGRCGTLAAQATALVQGQQTQTRSGRSTKLHNYDKMDMSDGP